MLEGKGGKREENQEMMERSKEREGKWEEGRQKGDGKKREIADKSNHYK